MIATLAGCDDVVPDVPPATGNGDQVVAGQLAVGKPLAAVKANTEVPSEERFVGERRHTFGGRNHLAVAGDDAVDFQAARSAGKARIPAPDAQYRVAQGPYDDLSGIEAYGLLPAYPLYRPASDIQPQYARNSIVLSQRCNYVNNSNPRTASAFASDFA